MYSNNFSKKDTENSLLLNSPRTPEFDETDDKDSPNDTSSIFCNPLILIIIFLVIVVIFILALVVLWKIDSTHRIFGAARRENTCTTPECITLSSSLLNWQNTSVDPCEDFYEFSCGKYPEHTVNEGTRVNEKDNLVMKLIRQFVLKNQSSNTNSEKALKLLYRKCIERHTEDRSHLKVESIQKEVFQNIQKIGKWPIADEKWNATEFDLNDMLSNMAELHMLQFGFFETGIIEYPINGSPKQLIIRPAMERFSIDSDYLVKITHAILRVNGIKDFKANLSTDIRECIKLEERLNDFVIDRDPEPASLSELNKAVPNVNFERIIRSFMNPQTGNWTSLKERISSARFQSFFHPEKNISSVISSTPPRVLANYVILKYIEYSYFYYAFNPKYLTETEYCLEVVTTLLPRASLRVFVRNHFKKENMIAATRMMESIKKAFIELIMNSEWLHNSTKSNAVLKVEKMKTVIGYTEEYEKQGALDEMFKTLDISTNDSFFSLMTKINRFKTEQLMDFVSSDSLLNPIDSLVIANAFYFPTKNSLSVLVPFLDKPLFDFQYPQYVTMAGVGRILAHEVGHAFDIHGRHTDETGKTRNWWTEENNAEYYRRATCFAKQFQDFKDPFFGGEQHNVSDVLAEIIADALGIEAAWIAFKKLDLANEPSLINFENHDNKRLYFQIAALDFCAPSLIEPHSQRFTYQLTHPTHRFRINVAFANSRSFAESYQCPVGSLMNPLKRCDMF